LDIEDKEFIILVGPSGCGKSTTLRMIAGLEEITEGEIYIGDKLVNDVQPKDRDIAMVFQNYALYPHMTVFDNMAFGLKLRKTPKDEIKRRVGEAAKILEIEHLLDRKPKALSGGQRQRVALGRAIVRNPKVFLMDEPLSNLDAKLRVQMRVEITKLHQRLATTFIYVTHDQTEAMTMGSRIVVMKDGFIQQVDLYRQGSNYGRSSGRPSRRGDLPAECSRQHRQGLRRSSGADGFRNLPLSECRWQQYYCQG
jgi:multiple sugar transport system ATP-binding protein